MSDSGKLTDATLIEFLRLVDTYNGNATAAGRSIGLAGAQARARVQEAKARKLSSDNPSVSELDKLTLQFQRLQRDYSILKKEVTTAETIREEIFKLAARTPEPPAWIEKSKGGSGWRGVPMTMWSDWHYGEVVNAAEVGGVNEFNQEIARRRIVTLVDKIVDLCFHHMGRGKPEYPGIVVCLGGDMISGDIHEELFATNDRTPQQSINDLTDIIAASLERVASKFGNVFVPCVVGNHGRDSRKPRMKGRVWTSHEWLIYTGLDRAFRNDKRIHFMIPSETDVYFRVYNTRFLLTHGDSLGVKGGDGIIGALGPIARGALKVDRSESEIGRNIDYIIMGHWHQPLWLPNAMVNNSLKGYDEFARLALRAPASLPSQLLWFCHPEWGVTARWEVLLETPTQTDAARNEWISWSQAKLAAIN